METIGAGRKFIVFVKNGKQYQRFIHQNKKGKYIEFQGKQIPLNQLKNIVTIHAEVQSISSKTAEKLQRKRRKIYYSSTPSYWK